MATKQELRALEGNMATKQDLARIENKMDDNFKALYDGYKLTYEKLTTLDVKVDNLSEKVDRHDVEIRVIKGNRKAKLK